MNQILDILIALVGLLPDETTRTILHPRPSGDLARESRKSFRSVGALNHTMKEIPLTNSPLKALVDDEDFELVSKHSWHLRMSYSKKHFYAEGGRIPGDNTHRFLMHRLVVRAERGIDVDHKNHNGLDNQKHNLRLATKSQNRMNSNTNSNKNGKRPSRFKGVYSHHRGNRWVSHLVANGKWIYIGSFKTEMEAAVAYNEAAKMHHGEFAVLNSV